MLPQPHNPQQTIKQEDDDQDDRNDDHDDYYYDDVISLTPTQFLSKYYSNNDSSRCSSESQWKDISMDVLCYIVVNYLDWKSVFNSCLFVNKEFFRRIVNNRQLFINLYNELFVLKEDEIQKLKHTTIFKHKNMEFDGKVRYGRLGYPNEHYHFWKDYDHSSENDSIYESLKINYVKSRTMTDSKLRIIRDLWNNAVNVYKNNKNVKPVQSQKEENQALLALIKRIIKDRLFIRKVFNCEMKRWRIEHHHVNYFMKKNIGESIAWQQFLEQKTLFEQVNSMILGESTNDMYETEEIVIGDNLDEIRTIDMFVKVLKNYPYAYCENILSFVANDITDRTPKSTSNIKEIFEKFPNLKSFIHRGCIQGVTPIKSYHLLVLVLVTGSTNGKIIKGILECDFPQLKHLELWLGDTLEITENDLKQDVLSPIENGKYPMLEYFGLRNTDRIDRFLETISHSNILRRLRILDLSHGSIHHQMNLCIFAKTLEEKGRNAFPLLELVDLHGIYLDENQIQSVKEIFDRMEIIVDLSESRSSSSIKPLEIATRSSV